MKWIPITEQKPTTADHVLVTLYWEPDDEGDEFYDVCELDYGVYHACGDPLVNQVIAWMLLPEPYKKEKLTPRSGTTDWIPIEKDKPRGGERVLATLYWEEDDWYEVCQLDYGVFNGIYHASGYPLANQVIAWMPIPEPYKKEKNNA